MSGGTEAAESPMTIAQWEVLDEDVSGELVDGQLEEEEVASFVHELVVTWLIHALRSWLADRGGFVFASDAKFAVGPTRGRKPDVSVFLPGRKPPASGASRVPPDMMIEVITPTPRDGRRDRIDKLGEYASFAVRHYWLVDPALRSVEVLELDATGRYAHALDVSVGRVDDIPGCPGLVLDLDALWAEVDALEENDESPR